MKQEHVYSWTEDNLEPEVSTPLSPELTTLLDGWNQGDREAFAEVMERAQKELRQIACRFLKGERIDHTLQPTALVNELYLRLDAQRRVNWHNRSEFFAVAAEIMRRILVDYARKSKAKRRGGGVAPVRLEEALGLPIRTSPQILALNDALDDLERLSPRQRQIVELKAMVGLTLEQIAHIMEIKPSKASQDWKTAKLFLRDQLKNA